MSKNDSNASLPPSASAVHMDLEAEQSYARTLETALAEVVRLRLATTEGTCAQRFDRAWQVATDALAYKS